MRVEEAAWVGARLAALPNPSPLVELGSSTLHFRTVAQPHVDRLIHRPLRERGVRVLHTDLTEAEGVDIAGDIFDPDVFARLKAARPAALLCCNMFEHVTDRQKLAGTISELVPSGGHVVLTVPHSYPLHFDPIDTYFRPSPQELAALFPEFVVVEGAVVPSITFGQRLMQEPGKLPNVIVKRLWWLLQFWVPPQIYKERNHRLLWLFRPYKQAAVVLRKR